MNYDWRNEGSVKEATKTGNHWSILTTESSGFGVDFSGNISVGQKVEIAVIGGSQVVGVKIDGNIIMLKTDGDLKREREEWLAEYHAKQLKEYEEKNDNWRKQVESLSEPLRLRMERIISEKGGFKEAFLDMASYELFCCTEADKLVDYFKGLFFIDGVKIPLEEANAILKEHQENSRNFPDMPKLSDGHSGNTHGGAINLGACVALGFAV